LDCDFVLDSEYFIIYNTRCSNFILCDDKSDRSELQHLYKNSDMKTCVSSEYQFITVTLQTLGLRFRP